MLEIDSYTTDDINSKIKNWENIHFDKVVLSVMKENGADYYAASDRAEYYDDHLGLSLIDIQPEY